jgi:autotransporter-associated beta strand protein
MKKKVLGIILLVAGLSFAAQAATATWNGPVAPTLTTTDGSWLTSTNWVGSATPVFNNTLDITYTYGGMSWVGNQTPTIRSLTFTDSVDTDVNLRTLNNGSVGAKILTFGGAGGAAININAGATGNINIGQGSNGGNIVLAEDLSITHNGDGSLSFLKRVDGIGGIVKSGSGKLILAVSNSYTGVTTLNSGALDINNAYALGTGMLAINGGTIGNTSAAAISNANNNAVTINGNFAFTGTQDLNLGVGATTLGTAAGTSRTINIGSATNALTLGGIIANGTTANQLIKNGTGTLILNGANTYSGGTTVSDGTVALGSSGTLGATTGALTVSGGTLNLGGTSQTVGTTTISGGTITNGTLTGSSYVGQSGTVAAILAGNSSALTKSTSGTLTLSGANTYGGGTVLSLGTLNIGHTNALGTGSLTINGGTLANTSASAINTTNAVAINGDFTFASAQSLGLLGSMTLGTAAGTSRTITHSSAGSNLNLDGNIADGTTANQLIKDGTGALNLNGINTFSGGLVIKRGTVNIGAASGAGTGAITLGDAAGGDAYLGLGSYTMTNAINLASGAAGNLSIGASGNTRNPTFSGAIALNGNNLTIKRSSTGNTVVSGGITGNGNLSLTNNSTGAIRITTTSINNTGSITVSGGATSGTNLISAVIGANVTTLTLDNQAKLIVSNANDYAGGTTVSSGLLIGAAAGAFGTGGMTVADGATLILKNDSTLNNLAALVLGSTSVLGLEFSGADTVGSISLDGGISTLGAGTWTAAQLVTAGLAGAYGGGSLTVIPEPATIGMLGLGAIITILLRRMRIR